MPSEKEYEDILYGEAQRGLQVPVNTRREIKAAGSAARRFVMQKRNELTQDITKRWRDGFKSLKEENDQMQVDLKKAYAAVDQMIYEGMSEMEEGIQK